MAPFKVKKILIPLDFSKTSLKALEYAVAISGKTRAEIILLHVIEELYPTDYFVAPTLLFDFQKDFIDQGNQYLNKLAKKLKEKGMPKIITLTEFGNVHQEILNTAKKSKADLIVMGTHGISGVKEFFIGSNTFRIIRDSKCPVLSVREKSKVPAFKTILMPFRDSMRSLEQVNYAISLALMFSSTLNILGIDTEFTSAHKNRIELEASRIKNMAEKYGVSCKTKVVSEAYIGDVVLKHARSVKADLIISMSGLDKTSLTEYFTGPFAQQVVNHSPIPVFSVRPDILHDLKTNFSGIRPKLNNNPVGLWFD